MYCPKCSQQQAPEAVRFCPRCGFPLDAVSQLIAHDGVPATRDAGAPGGGLSARREGMRQGAKLTLAGLVLTPAGYALCFLVHSAVPVVIPLTVFLAGLAWMLYSRVFGEADSPRQPRASRLEVAAYDSASPTAAGIPVSIFGTRGTSTAEMARAPGVTEQTTRLLDHD